MDFLDLLNLPSFGKQEPETSWRNFFLWVPIIIAVGVATYYLTR